LILIKLLIFHIALLLSFNFYAQTHKKEDKISVWQREKKSIQYEKSEEYKGPSDWYASSPGAIDEPEVEEQSTSYEGLDYQPEQIQRDRQVSREGFDRGGGNGTEAYDPDVLSPEIDTPQIDPTDDSSDREPLFSDGFWKVLGILILFVLVIFLIYQLIKNAKPPVKGLKVQSIDKNWNPTIISKTELELLLESALEKEDYREGVRIYFNFILKELIKKGWIKWKQEKTNYSYILEMKSRSNSHLFEECVRIYDLVWYGEYQLSKSDFEEIQPVLLSYYKLIEKDDK
jgi:hypothetical protein